MFSGTANDKGARVARLSVALGILLALGGCYEQQGGNNDAKVAASSITTASIGSAVADGKRLVNAAPGVAGADGIESFLAELKRDARLRKQEALQMRAQVAAYREAVRDAREQAAKYRLEIARIQEEIRREREEMEKYKAEINVLRQEMVAQAATIRKDRDQLRRLVEETEKVRREMALIRQGVLQMRDDLLPGSAAASTLSKADGSASGPALPKAVPASSTAGPSNDAGRAAVKVRVHKEQDKTTPNAADKAAKDDANP